MTGYWPSFPFLHTYIHTHIHTLFGLAGLESIAIYCMLMAMMKKGELGQHSAILVNLFKDYYIFERCIKEYRICTNKEYSHCG